MGARARRYARTKDPKLDVVYGEWGRLELAQDRLLDDGKVRERRASESGARPPPFSIGVFAPSDVRGTPAAARALGGARRKQAYNAVLNAVTDSEPYRATMETVERQCVFINGNWEVKPEVELEQIDAEMDAVNFDSLLSQFKTEQLG